MDTRRVTISWISRRCRKVGYGRAYSLRICSSPRFFKVNYSFQPDTLPVSPSKPTRTSSQKRDSRGKSRVSAVRPYCCRQLRTMDWRKPSRNGRSMRRLPIVSSWLTRSVSSPKHSRTSIRMGQTIELNF